jgi:hypothetical protein
VQIPRCRATVSEDIATGHWAYAWEGRLQHPDAEAQVHILTRKARRPA